MVDVSNIYSPVLKLIDFGNYVKYSSGEQLALNNLEFAAPESLMENNLALIGTHTDIWALGVYLYVFLSGVSPFLDDSSEETTSNILKCDYCFPEEYFRGISGEAIQLLQSMLVGAPEQRIVAEAALNSPWLAQNLKVSVISTGRLSSFIERRAPKANFSVPVNNKIYSGWVLLTSAFGPRFIHSIKTDDKCTAKGHLIYSVYNLIVFVSLIVCQRKEVLDFYYYSCIKAVFANVILVHNIYNI